MTRDIQSKSNIKFKLNEEFGKWIDLANACGVESSVDNIRNLARSYLTKYFPDDQVARAEFIKILESFIGKKLTEHCLKNSNVSVGLCLQEIIEVRSVLSFCADWNKQMGDLSSKTSLMDLDTNDLENNPVAFSSGRISDKGIEDADLQNLFDYRTNFNTSIQLKQNTFYLKHETSKFISLIEKEKIDVRNIRLCQRCGKIFWLKRKLQIGCSSKCSNALNMTKRRRKMTREIY